MNPQGPKGKEEKTNVCGGFERMSEMMRQCCKSGESLPDSSSMMSLMEKCCRPQTEKRGEGGDG